ncbi:hypothetical protein HAX54_011236 [Datura stramonium]|uniref:Uncharacterized protein n=1 Tax=Datura stramonium TaxID=4076 RepID=A0ABS8TKA6_DATST|nr:hypothetical protein [Datura stramonium]
MANDLYGNKKPCDIFHDLFPDGEFTDFILCRRIKRKVGARTNVVQGYEATSQCPTKFCLFQCRTNLCAKEENIGSASQPRYVYGRGTVWKIKTVVVCQGQVVIYKMDIIVLIIIVMMIMSFERAKASVSPLKWTSSELSNIR